MKLYFSVWGYYDPTRVGYDSVGVTYYETKPLVFAGVGSTEVYEVEIADRYTKEQARAIGERAVKWMEKNDYYTPSVAVRKVMEEMNFIKKTE